MLSQKTKDIVKATAPILQTRGVEITARMYERLFSGLSVWPMLYLLMLKILII